MTTCDRCGRPAWKPHGGMGGHIAPDYETWCLHRGGQWCRVAEMGAKAERTAVVAFLESRMDSAAAEHAFEREGVLDATRAAIFNGTHRTEET